LRELLNFNFRNLSVMPRRGREQAPQSAFRDPMCYLLMSLVVVKKAAGMVTIQSKFIGDFKLGDNVCYNLDVVGVLYRRFNLAEGAERRLLCKPIIVLLASVVEAALYDFHKRVKLFTVEGVKNLTTETINYIRGAKIDDFAKYIDSAKRQKLFGSADDEFYEKMHDLRKLRNRIHIQNEKNAAPRDERNAFTPEAKRRAEQVVEKTLKTLSAKFSRDHDQVGDFILPWTAHFD